MCEDDGGDGEAGVLDGTDDDGRVERGKLISRSDS